MLAMQRELLPSGYPSQQYPQVQYLSSAGIAALLGRGSGGNTAASSAAEKQADRRLNI